MAAAAQTTSSATSSRGSIGFGGEPAECRDNMRFTDADEDGFLDEIEADAAEALGCEG
jgi:hypothetical protein